jgi:hypothetical protein
MFPRKSITWSALPITRIGAPLVLQLGVAA